MQTQHPDQYQQLHLIASLFPNAMQDSELGEIPAGWKVSTVGQEFDVTMGQSPPGSSYNEDQVGTPFFQGRRDFGWRYPEQRVYTTEPKRMAKAGDTLLSVRAPVGDINKATFECCIGRGLASLRHKKGCEAYSYYSCWNLGKHFESYDTEGTVFGSINQKSLKALQVIKPADKVLDSFSKIVGSLDLQINNLSLQSKTLEALRDTLLPKLLSSELQIPTGDAA